MHAYHVLMDVDWESGVLPADQPAEAASVASVPQPLVVWNHRQANAKAKALASKVPPSRWIIVLLVGTGRRHSV